MLIQWAISISSNVTCPRTGDGVLQRGDGGVHSVYQRGQGLVVRLDSGQVVHRPPSLLIQVSQLFQHHYFRLLLFQTIIISDNDRPSHLLLLWLLGLGGGGLGGEQQQRQHRHHRLQHLPSHRGHGGSSGETRSGTALHYWLEWWRGPSWKEFCCWDCMAHSRIVR